jgi:hypothetical protein
MVASASQIAQWNREFQDLGAKQVRADLALRRWDNEKRDAAKRWLEREDLARWAAEHPPDSSQGTFFLNLRNAKWWGYITGAIFLIYGLFRLWRKMF